MRSPVRITQDVADNISSLLKLGHKLRGVALLAGVRNDVVWSVKHDNYIISNDVKEVVQADDDCFSWSEYPNGLY